MSEIVELLRKYGPLTGKEIHERSSADDYETWKYCNTNAEVVLQTFGRRYLRLDRQVDGFARLSPSIMREFHNYTVVGLKNQTDVLSAKAKKLHGEIEDISNRKLQLALGIATKITDNLRNDARDKVCFMIAGDVAYKMAHLEPRPEFSTGEVVNGSDLDIVIVYEGLPIDTVAEIDAAMYEQKRFLLNNPGHKEEIDYIIKDIPKVQLQLEFSGFTSMVASKVLDESVFLYGNFELFKKIKRMLQQKGISDKLNALVDEAMKNREKAKKKLLTFAADTELRNLLFTTEEQSEFY
jgi:hypothetical protein